MVPLPPDLRTALADAGAVFGEMRGRERVLRFSSVEEEYAALTTGAAVVEFTGRTQLEFTGSDRAAFLHNLCTNDIRCLKPGDGTEVFITSVQGKTLGHGFVFCGEESLVYETVADQAARLLPHFEKYHIREKVEFRDRSDEWAELLVAGPIADDLVKKAGIPAPSDIWHRRVDLLGSAAFLFNGRRDWPIGVADVWLMLRDLGAVPCGHLAFESARIEAAFPLYGVDITDENLPQEVDRNAQAISFTKGCYLGQETVARIDALGHVNRTLVQVQFRGENGDKSNNRENVPVPISGPAPGTELTLEGKPVGRVTSAAWSPRINAPLALAYVRRGHNTPGTRLQSPLGEAEIVVRPLRRSGGQ